MSMTTHQTYSDLTPWKPALTVVPEKWTALSMTLTSSIVDAKRIYIMEARYDAQGIALLLQSWGLSWQLIMAALLWEHKEQLPQITLHDTTHVLSHIAEVEHIVQCIVDDDLPILLNPPY